MMKVFYWILQSNSPEMRDDLIFSQRIIFFFEELVVDPSSPIFSALVPNFFAKKSTERNRSDIGTSRIFRELDCNILGKGC